MQQVFLQRPPVHVSPSNRRRLTWNMALPQSGLEGFAYTGSAYHRHYRKGSSPRPSLLYYFVCTGTGTCRAPACTMKPLLSNNISSLMPQAAICLLLLETHLKRRCSLRCIHYHAPQSLSTSSMAPTLTCREILPNESGQNPVPSCVYLWSALGALKLHKDIRVSIKNEAHRFSSASLIGHLTS
ncbi:hypothetical protein J3E68DRAFT_139896 [Trichoderma sp. SZMC 28012]